MKTTYHEFMGVLVRSEEEVNPRAGLDLRNLTEAQ